MPNTILSTVTGQVPISLSLTVFQVLIYDNNLTSIHKEFVSKRHPSLKTIVKSWMVNDTSTDISTYCEHLIANMDIGDVSLYSLCCFVL